MSRPPLPLRERIRAITRAPRRLLRAAWLRHKIVGARIRIEDLEAGRVRYAKAREAADAQLATLQTQLYECRLGVSVGPAHAGLPDRIYTTKADDREVNCELIALAALTQSDRKGRRRLRPAIVAKLQTVPGGKP